MKCIRDNKDGIPCERCKRNNRTCRIPDSRPLGRKRGARGRYQGFEKAVRKLQSEMKNARMEDEANRIQEIACIPVKEHPTSEAVPFREAKETRGTKGYHRASSPLEINPPYSLSNRRNSILREAGVQEEASSSVNLQHSDQEPISNPLALLADASDAARALECPSMSTRISPIPVEESDPAPRLTDRVTESLGHHLLHRPGYVSLGLRLNRQCLEHGLDALLAPVQMERKYPNYFKGSGDNNPRDVGPDLDPVDLGLVTMDEASYLFPM